MEVREGKVGALGPDVGVPKEGEASDLSADLAMGVPEAQQGVGAWVSDHSVCATGWKILAQSVCGLPRRANGSGLLSLVDEEELDPKNQGWPSKWVGGSWAFPTDRIWSRS